MQNRRDIIDFGLSLPLTYEDHPFAQEFEAEPVTALRHKGNKKIFALIMRHGGELLVNVKCDPFEADFLRDYYAGVIPGWHMNKTHWNSIILQSDVPDDEIRRMIEASYWLTKPKR